MTWSARNVIDQLNSLRTLPSVALALSSLPQANAMHASSVEFEPKVDEFEAVGVSKAPRDARSSPLIEKNWSAARDGRLS
jgi:hypothetical protein